MSLSSLVIPLLMAFVALYGMGKRKKALGCCCASSRPWWGC